MRHLKRNIKVEITNNVFNDHIDSFKNQWTYEKTPNGKKSTLILPGHISLKSVGFYTVIETAGKDTETHYTSTNDGKTYREYRDVRLDTDLTIGTLIGLIVTRNDVILKETGETKMNKGIASMRCIQPKSTDKLSTHSGSWFSEKQVLTTNIIYKADLRPFGEFRVLNHSTGTANGQRNNSSMFKDNAGNHWIAQQNLDIRSECKDMTLEETAAYIKKYAEIKKVVKKRSHKVRKMNARLR